MENKWEGSHPFLPSGLKVTYGYKIQGDWCMSK